MPYKSAIMIGTQYSLPNTFQILQKFAATPITNQCGLIRELMSELLKTVISNNYKFASKKYDENRQ